MGWNSWDVFGASVTEQEILDAARFMATHLAPHGWEYIVVDIQWYEPTASSSLYHPFAALEMDQVSRLLPAVNRFPSAAGGHGFGPLADAVHALGLKFGVHMMRGIPRQAVHLDAPILGTDRRARDIAANNICSWNTDMYGVNPLAAGAQDYYDSVFEQYASWNVDFVKVDDALTPYATGEIELIRSAIDRCPRQMVLSLSCGPTDTAHAEHLRAHADMWRMTGDLWDSWSDLLGMFDACRRWSPYGGDGHWPDADMLPLGQLAIRSREHGLGRRWTRLSQDEQVAMMTLWCIARSPLMLGCDLPSLDPWTLSLLTNDAVLAVLRQSRSSRQVTRTSEVVVWTADGPTPDVSYLAVFNIGPATTRVALPTALVGRSPTARCRDLWSHEDLGPGARVLTVEVPSHGARLLELGS